MKPLVATAIIAHSTLGFLVFINSAEAFFSPHFQTEEPLTLPVQYDPFQKYSPGRSQGSIAGRAAFCRCYPYSGFQKRLVCHYPGRPTTVQLVDRCY